MRAVRARRLLRQLAEQARDQAFSRDKASRHSLVSAGRELEVVLRGRSDMGMTWDPFTEPARRSIVRAQEVAQMFGSSSIGTAHMTFALAESDDEVGSALAAAIDREAMRNLLGGAGAGPADEMTFTRGAKQSIELAFESAHRLKQNLIGPAHP